MLSFGSILFHLDYVYKDNTDPENEDHQDRFFQVPGYGEDFAILNARILFVPANSKVEVALWGRNLLDDRGISQPGGLTGDLLGTYHVGVQDPTTYGVDLKYIY